MEQEEIERLERAAILEKFDSRDKEAKERDKMRELVKYGSDLGAMFLLTGLIAIVIYLQQSYPGIAAVFLITGGFIMVYINWIKRRNKIIFGEDRE